MSDSSTQLLNFIRNDVKLLMISLMENEHFLSNFLCLQNSKLYVNNLYDQLKKKLSRKCFLCAIKYLPL